MAECACKLCVAVASGVWPTKVPDVGASMAALVVIMAELDAASPRTRIPLPTIAANGETALAEIAEI